MQDAYEPTVGAFEDLIVKTVTVGDTRAKVQALIDAVNGPITVKLHKNTTHTR